MNMPSSICVYCGSAANVAARYRHAASELGRLLGDRKIRVVYGGGRVGLMGLVADAALAAGGDVVGIIPRHIEEMEVAHQKLTELIVVETMHERKRMMVDRAQGFVALPGGLGTLDETFEILTWKQLSLHHHPVVILNIDGYWDPLLQLIRHAAAEGFVRPEHAHLFRAVAKVEEVLPALMAEPGGGESASELT
ncbi:MAG TPA: TIGR00730 family Rossman fold protein [Alphaproteobacteria bacterium]|nr:TIGR00730 family Rossman fold protein [Alphaproteobacteria bacterium]